MFYFSDTELDALLNEYLPDIDLTTVFLRLENKPAKIQLSTCESTVVCCTEEAMRIFSKLGIQTTLFTPSGEMIEKEVKFFEGEGLAKTINAALPAVENLIEFASGIATRTRLLVDKSTEVKKDIIISATFDTIPYTKKITIKGIKAGGGAIHCNNLSDSILILDNHISFLGDIETLQKRIDQQKNMHTGKTIIAEVSSTAEALRIGDSGVDIIQLKNLTPQDIATVKNELYKQNKQIKLAVKGKITPDNINKYAASGADILVTSWICSGSPVDLNVNVTPIFDVY